MITEEQNERLTQILEGLEPELKNVYPSGKTFIEDQIKRHEQYGADIRLSPKQWRWLEDLYTNFVGPLSELGGERDPMDPKDDGPVPEYDDKDEIPF